MTVHVVGGLLVDGDRVLLGHRSPTRRWYPDVWDVPGGHVEPGEQVRDALVRELDEELGVGVVTAHVHERVRVDEPGEDDVVIDVWLVTSWSGTPVNRCPDEHDQLRWFSAAEIPVAELAHPALVGVVRSALGPRRGV
ncbi:NUDIX domain-containing protein [Cellulomonas sp. URHB0016]